MIIITFLINCFILIGVCLASDDRWLGEKWVTGTIPTGWFFNTGKMFYWLFSSRDNPDTDPLVIWLTGGPGCSSELAIVSENGPYWMDKKSRLSKNIYSWNNHANVLYVDQPLGTGFSRATFAWNFDFSEKGVARDFRQFLSGFMKKHPEFLKRDMYITGESYSGHYIPAIGALLVEKPLVGVNLKGVAIGNGWVDPWLQYNAYPAFAFDNKLINATQYSEAKGAYNICTESIPKLTWPEAYRVCNIVQDTYNIIGDLNVYDIRKKCVGGPMCYDMDYMDVFFNDKQVQAELGIEGQYWQQCDPTVYMFMIPDWDSSMVHQVGVLLNHGVPVVVYSGDKDYICNWYGGLRWVNSVYNWEGWETFQNTPMKPWLQNGKEVGQIKNVENFTFIRVYDAGHMVPMDQPKVSEFLLLQQVLNKKLQPHEEKN